AETAIFPGGARSRDKGTDLFVGLTVPFWPVSAVRVTGRYGSTAGSHGNITGAKRQTSEGSGVVAVAFAGWREVPPGGNDERCERRACEGEDPGRCLVENNAL